MEDTVTDFQMQLPSGGCNVCGDFNETNYTIDERRDGLIYDGKWLCKKCFVEEHGKLPDGA